MVFGLCVRPAIRLRPTHGRTDESTADPLYINFNTKHTHTRTRTHTFGEKAESIREHAHEQARRVLFLFHRYSVRYLSARLLSHNADIIIEFRGMNEAAVPTAATATNGHATRIIISSHACHDVLCTQTADRTLTCFVFSYRVVRAPSGRKAHIAFPKTDTNKLINEQGSTGSGSTTKQHATVARHAKGVPSRLRVPLSVPSGVVRPFVGSTVG